MTGLCRMKHLTDLTEIVYGSLHWELVELPPADLPV